MRIFFPTFLYHVIIKVYQIIKVKQAPAPKEPISYMQVTTNPSKRINLSLKEIQAYWSMFSINRGYVHITSPQEVLTMVKHMTIVYKVFNPVKMEIVFVDEDIIGKCLTLCCWM